jgi:hypothetical protein
MPVIIKRFTIIEAKEDVAQVLIIITDQGILRVLVLSGVLVVYLCHLIIIMITGVVGGFEPALVIRLKI